MYDELPLDTVNDVLDHAAKRFGSLAQIETN